MLSTLLLISSVCKLKDYSKGASGLLFPLSTSPFTGNPIPWNWSGCQENEPAPGTWQPPAVPYACCSSLLGFPADALFPKPFVSCLRAVILLCTASLAIIEVCNLLIPDFSLYYCPWINSFIHSNTGPVPCRCCARCWDKTGW